ncbi:hypothetical protein KL930_001732 [Ogataea haglerorum]|uniref:Uncharacterized protein n=1 Tax=Ogataea haglerorum TaxID=1937702 RepID=A0AAN6I1V6_9ASCO|nr:uncharacterized protein KL911_001673 [Ogataea haglerorum]KAG7729936.1 hypothetical protein KL933_001016 [Ogataea haglerorum]KAG7732637.1 hypothetical protein KL948_002067 [Ogataea haglerorum]KAG7740168.1 hypothetical protein KL923_002009 [Ogataea haglerorum]KAG7755616.1 hypothetical protein KL911_001673 [Ogataea haglerorum]KAG7775858.1 hypothetical protein KL922_003923 [Ogataea haglerorum]
MSRIDYTPTRPLVLSESPSGVPPDGFCQHLDLIVRLVYIMTGECPLDVSRKQIIHFFKPISAYAGYLSITAWLFAQIPQVIKNYSEKSVDGLSLGFLCCWFAGDLLNFVSCLMTDALLFQILLSSYYLIIDIVLAGQFYYYSRLYHNPQSRFYHQRRAKRLGEIKTPRTALRTALDAHRIREIDADSSDRAYIPAEHISSPISMGRQQQPNELKITNSVTKLISSSFVMGFGRAEAAPINSTISSQNKTNNSALLKIFHSLMTLSVHQVGAVLAWCCTLLYISSRFPQILTNNRLKSTRGISPKFVICALLGNLCYSMSLLTCKNSLSGGDTSRKFWRAELSYLLGALGTVALDCTLLLQWYKWDYNRGTVKSPEIEASTTSRESTSGENYIKLKRSNSPATRSAYIKIPMSPHHVRKLSENTPLSPIDFLLDDYMANAQLYKGKKQFDEVLKLSNYGSIS